MFATKKIVVSIAFILISIAVIFGVLILFDPFHFSGVQVDLENSTRLEIESGIVTVNEQITNGSLVLQVGDEIEVLEGGAANVVFFDDSVARINSGSKLKLEVLDSQEYESGQSYILINLENGEIWSKVPRQTSPDIVFKVKTISVNATIRGSALNIKTDDQGKTEIDATEHSSKILAIDPVNGEVLEEVTIIEGQKAKIGFKKEENDNLNANEDNSQEENIDSLESEMVKKIIIEAIENVDKMTAWFRNNFDKDRLFEIALRKKINEIRKLKAGSLPGSFGYKMKNIRDAISLLAAGNEKDDIRLKIAERKLIEANILLSKGESDSAKKQMIAAADAIQDLVKKGKSNDINKVIQNSKRLLRETLPNESDYEAKNFISNLEENIAPLDKKLQIREYNFSRKILDLYDYSKGSDKKGSELALEKFKNELIDKYKNNPEDPDLKNAIYNPYFEMTIRNLRSNESDFSSAQLLNDFFAQEIIDIKGFIDLLPNVEDNVEESSDSDNEPTVIEDKPLIKNNLPPVTKPTKTPPPIEKPIITETKPVSPEASR